MQSVSITAVSLDLLTDSLKKCLLLVGRQEVERAGKRTEQHVRISVIQIGSGQKVRTDHLETVATRFVRSEHQSCRFECFWSKPLQLTTHAAMLGTGLQEFP